MAVNLEDLEIVCPGVYKKNNNTFFIQCNVNGTLHYCIKERLDKLIKKHGTVEAVGQNYTSRAAKQEQKQCESDKRIVPIEHVDCDTIQQRTQLKSPPRYRHYTDGDKKLGYALSDGFTICMRRQLFVQNGNFCNGCRWWTCCNAPQKKWKTYKEQPQRKKVPMGRYLGFDFHTEGLDDADKDFS